VPNRRRRRPPNPRRRNLRDSNGDQDARQECAEREAAREPSATARTSAARLTSASTCARSRNDAQPTASAASALRLADHPRRDELALWIEDALRGREIDVALLGGHKYMINDCLGVKASSGKFKLKLDNPSVHFQNTGLVIKFSIPHASISVVKIRIRPTRTCSKLCKFRRQVRSRRRRWRTSRCAGTWIRSSTFRVGPDAILTTEIEACGIENLITGRCSGSGTTVVELQLELAEARFTLGVR